MTKLEPDFARRAWMTFEPLHAIVYFAPEKKKAYESAGLKGGWMGYFASRAAAMGPVDPHLVQATFFNFHPVMVARAIPDAWRLSTPALVLQARLQVVDLAYRRALGGWIEAAELPEVVASMRAAVAACTVAGRPLFAAHAALPWPDAAHLALWHGCTLLREHRGDGHVAALTAAGFDGCEAHLMAVGAGGISADALQPFRGWSDAEWTRSAERLRERGLLQGDGFLTDEGRRVRGWVEDTTDRLALEPWEALGTHRSHLLLETLREPKDRIREAGDITYPNPMGLPADDEEGGTR